MSASLRSKRLSPPLMFAFRGAHAAHEHVKSDAASDAGEADRAAARRRSTRASLGEEELRRQVSLDVETLMNAVALESTLDLSEHPQVRKSILNFGCPDMSTRTIDEARLDEVREEIAVALQRYEPRLIRDTIKVTRETLEDDDLRLRYVVRADLACIPVAAPVQFFADVELDSGAVTLSRV